MGRKPQGYYTPLYGFWTERPVLLARCVFVGYPYVYAGGAYECVYVNSVDAN